MAEPIDIRSFRAVFELERRIYRVDRYRLNPAGVPLRGLVYGCALLALVGVSERLPVLGGVLSLLPWYLRWLGLPAALAALLTIARIDGRPFHLAARALAVYVAGPRRLSAMARSAPLRRRWHPPPLLAVVDGSEPRLRCMRYRGPGAVLVGCSHQRLEWGRGRRVTLVSLGVDRPLRRAVAIELQGRAALDVRAAR